MPGDATLTKNLMRTDHSFKKERKSRDDRGEEKSDEERSSSELKVVSSPRGSTIDVDSSPACQLGANCNSPASPAEVVQLYYKYPKSDSPAPPAGGGPTNLKKMIADGAGLRDGDILLQPGTGNAYLDSDQGLNVSAVKHAANAIGKSGSRRQENAIGKSGSRAPAGGPHEKKGDDEEKDGKRECDCPAPLARGPTLIGLTEDQILKRARTGKRWYEHGPKKLALPYKKSSRMLWAIANDQYGGTVVPNKNLKKHAKIDAKFVTLKPKHFNDASGCVDVIEDQFDERERNRLQNNCKDAKKGEEQRVADYKAFQKLSKQLTCREAFEEFHMQGGATKYPGAFILRYDLCDLSKIDCENSGFELDGYINVTFALPDDKNLYPRNVIANKHGDDLSMNEELAYAFPSLFLRNDEKGEMSFLDEVTKAIREGDREKCAYWSDTVVPHPYNDEKAPTGVSLVRFRHQLKTTFKEKFELENFPFDVQDLHMVIYVDDRSTFPCRPVICVEGRMQEKTVLPDWTMLKPEWKIVEYAGKQSYVFILRVQRNYKYYVCKVFVPLALMNSLVFAVFAIDVAVVEERVGLTLGLLFTVLAFQWVTMDSLPKVSYSTMLDKYMRACMWMVVLIGFESITMGLLDNFHDEEDTESYECIRNIDNGIAFMFFMMWVGAHLWFISRVWVYLQRVKEKFGVKCVEDESAGLDDKSATDLVPFGMFGGGRREAAAPTILEVRE